MIDTCVSSDRAKTIIVMFMLAITNSKSVSHARGFIRANVEVDKHLSVFVCCVQMQTREVAIKRTDLDKKINTEKKVTEVLHSKIFILISLGKKFLLKQIDSKCG